MNSEIVTAALFELRDTALDVREQRFGAKCDWHQGQGTNDTLAFTKAAQAASASYQVTHRPVEVRLGGECRIDSTVRFGSGVHWTGPGTVVVPNQTAAVLRAEDADDVEISGVTIRVITQSCGANNASCAALGWQANQGDKVEHHHVIVRGNRIEHSNWGILVAYAAGQGSLRDVEIRDNTITSPGSYQDADGIHVGGRVKNFLISGNRVMNRGDAGVAASSELPDYICSNGVIEDNALIENQVGLDNSGCRSTVWRGNFSYATLPSRASNPAFRSIDYLGLTPDQVLVTGNYLRNSPVHNEYAAKVDDGSSPRPTHVIFQQNTIDSPLALYLRGSAIRVRGNVFLSDRATFTIDFDEQHSVPTDDVGVEPNAWRGSGLLNVGDNRALLSRLSLARQSAARSFTVTQPDIFHVSGERKLAGHTAVREKTFTLAVGRRSPLRLGDCVSLQKHVPGLTGSDSIDVTPGGSRETSPLPVVVWGFSRSNDALVVKACAVAASAVLPASLQVKIN